MNQINFGGYHEKSHLLIPAMSTLLLLGACGNDDVSKPSDKQPTKTDSKPSTSENTGEQGSDSMKITKTIQEVGGVGLEGQADTYDDSIIKAIDDTLIIANPVKSNVTSTYEVEISILEKNKWVYKSKEVDILDKVFTNPDGNERSYTVEQFGSDLLLKTKELNTDHKGYIEKYYIVSFDKNAEPTYKEIHEFKGEGSSFEIEATFHPYEMHTLVDGNNGPYLLVTTAVEKDKFEFTLKDNKGKAIRTIKDPNSLLYSHASKPDTLMERTSGSYYYYDEKKDLLYYPSAQQKNLHMVYDMKKNDLLWDERGKAKTFGLSVTCGYLDKNNIFTGTVHTGKGIYTLYEGECMGKNSIIMSYMESQKDNTLLGSGYVEIPRELKTYKTALADGKNEVYVYTIVEYKGKPTVQKHIINKVK
ncbi:hypothetical protein [Bacillus bombysepticus]|uniref:hypothetical protein n=1 Tax=Bacillus bombysepticus TaxID=658666 RepID=UPI003016D9D2